MKTKKEIIKSLRKDGIKLPPLSLRFLGSPAASMERGRFDALIDVSWKKKAVRFAVECVPLSTPKAFEDGLNRLKESKPPCNYLPMLITSFLREEQLQKLEQEEISGIDLCGNGVVVARNKFFVFRGGGKNRFSSSAPIKNIYRKNSSMAARVFLSRSSYESVQNIRLEINRRNPLVSRWDKKPISLSTVSKVLKVLEEDLIVGRNGGIRLLQPDKLLENLNRNYTPPKITRRVRLKVPGGIETIRKTLLIRAEKGGLPLTATGLSTAERYAVSPRDEPLSVYCPDPELLLEGMPPSRMDRFPNLELIETDDETVYFDCRREADFYWASPGQVYLELMSGDKRDRETAGQVRALILSEPQL